MNRIRAVVNRRWVEKPSSVYTYKSFSLLTLFCAVIASVIWIISSTLTLGVWNNILPVKVLLQQFPNMSHEPWCGNSCVNLLINYVCGKKRDFLNVFLPVRWNSLNSYIVPQAMQFLNMSHETWCGKLVMCYEAEILASDWSYWQQGQCTVLDRKN